MGRGALAVLGQSSRLDSSSATTSQHLSMMLSSWLWACLMLTTVFAIVTHAESTLWGTYRPQLLFGLRPRMPQTLLTGFMYYSPTSIQGGAPTRHLASVNPGPDYFRWKYHDGRNFGIQEIVDHEHNYLLRRVLSSLVTRMVRQVTGALESVVQCWMNPSLLIS